MLPIARPPLFVLITALDALAGQKGIVIALVFGLALFGTGYFALKSIGKDLNSILSVIILVALLVTPVNFVRKWILSDAVCVFFSIAALVYLFESKDERFSLPRSIFLSILIASAGLTQTYGLIGPLIGTGVLFIFAARHRQVKLIKFLCLTTILSVAFLVLIYYLWYNLIPHDETPTIFSLLKLSTGMFDFYLHAWGFYFLPFVPMFLGALLADKNKVFHDPYLISIWLSVVVFMFLALFYQWKDARFTFIFWPFFIIALFKTVDLIDEKYRKFYRICVGISATLIIFQSVLLYTGNEWWPDIRQVGLDPRKTWVAEVLLSEPVDDRFRLQEECFKPDRLCSEMIVDDDNYVKKVIDAYLKIDKTKLP